MPDWASIVGVWDFGGMPAEILDDDGTLVMRLPGAPRDFYPVLEPVDDKLVLRGGSFDGATLTLVDDRLSIGPIEVTRRDEPYDEPPGHGLLPAQPPDDEDRHTVFAALESGFGDGSELEWDGSYPKYEFVQWLTAQDRYIFHGSNNPEIDEFVPVRTSVELKDHGERGNLGAVYGTHDGVWSLFFSVIDRSNLVGSIRNGVSTFEAPDGRSVDVYQFSVHHESLPERPFKTGALYVLPRATFRRLPMWPGGPASNEWASEESVRPLARLIVDPEDFPFLDQVGGHDDGPLLRMFELQRLLIAAGTAARAVDGGYEIDLAWSEDVAAAHDEWLELWSRFMPTVDARLDGSGEARTWTLRGPEAFRQTAAGWLGELLES